MCTRVLAPFCMKRCQNVYYAHVRWFKWPGGVTEPVGFGFCARLALQKCRTSSRRFQDSDVFDIPRYIFELYERRGKLSVKLRRPGRMTESAGSIPACKNKKAGRNVHLAEERDAVVKRGPSIAGVAADVSSENAFNLAGELPNRGRKAATWLHIVHDCRRNPISPLPILTFSLAVILAKVCNNLRQNLSSLGAIYPLANHRSR